MEAALSIGTVVIATVFVLAIWIEAWRFPDWVWAHAKYRRGLWLVYLIVFPLMWIPYLLFVRPRLLGIARRV